MGLNSSIQASSQFLRGTNPVLGRELRQALRNERAFALLAIYVSILGAVVAAQFPADQTVAIDSVRPGTGAGYQLFLAFCGAQAFFVVAVLPALAAGALAQERERGTLESFLLTPLTPREIVWGKAAGVLCFGGLLLAATLPLTSLSFLLGGVSPADVITAYAVLLALAAFVTGFGLYCAARWTNAVRAIINCYALLPFALALAVVFMGPGSIIAGATLIIGSFWAALGLLPRWKASRVGLKLGIASAALFYLALAALFVLVILLLAGSYGLGLRLFLLIFVTPYFLFIAKLGLERTGDELGRHREPEGPARERLNDLRTEWQRTVEASAPATVSPTGRFTYAPQPGVTPQDTYGKDWIESGWAELAPEPTPATKVQPQPTTVNAADSAVSKRQRETARQHSFLPDGWNPVFTRDLRAGLLGRWSWLARTGYGALIAGQAYFVLRLGLPLLAGDDAFRSAWQEVAIEWPSLARLQISLILVAGAIFGARAFAPEREQQTLPQLLTTPMPHRAIIGGKLLAAMVYTGYAFVLCAPLTVLMALLSLLAPGQAVRVLALQLLLGVFAAAWGIFCSMRGITARRALGWSLGGIGALIGSGMILSLVDERSSNVPGAPMEFWTRVMQLMPLELVQPLFARSASGGLAPWIPFVIYGGIAAVLLIVTIFDFKSYAAQV